MKGRTEHRNSFGNEARVSLNSVESPFRVEGGSPPQLRKLITGANSFDEPSDVNLEDLWRFGIPVNIRKVLWPFKIENKLEIS